MKILLILFYITLASEAAIYKGERTYNKHCYACHKSGKELANTMKRSVWRKLLNKNNEGASLANIHLWKNNTSLVPVSSLYQTNIYEYFKSLSYKKELKGLRQYFMHYAKDTVTAGSNEGK